MKKETENFISMMDNETLKEWNISDVTTQKYTYNNLDYTRELFNGFCKDVDFFTDLLHSFRYLKKNEHYMENIHYSFRQLGRSICWGVESCEEYIIIENEFHDNRDIYERDTEIYYFAVEERDKELHKLCDKLLKTYFDGQSVDYCEIQNCVIKVICNRVLPRCRKFINEYDAEHGGYMI